MLVCSRQVTRNLGPRFLSRTSTLLRQRQDDPELADPAHGTDPSVYARLPAEQNAVNHCARRSVVRKRAPRM